MPGAGDVKEAVFARPERAAAVAARRGPVWWDDRFAGWVVSSYALVDEVVRSPGVFSSRELEFGPPAPHADTPVLRSLIATDPPEHGRLRRVIGRAFTPRAVAGAEEAVRRTARELLHAQPRDAVEVVEAFASPLTVTMLAALLGVPPTHRADFVRWTHLVAAFVGPAAEDPDGRAEFGRVVGEMEDFLRRSPPRPTGAPRTVLDTLRTACGRGELTERELLDVMILLIVAGHETTTRWIYHAVLCLERFPEVLGALRSDPGCAPGVLEEVVRFLPPTGGTDRFTTTETTLGGQAIPTGHRVVAHIASANRDPAVFPEPHRFDPARRPVRHLGFGRGPHACLGAHLARLEARIALTSLVEHVPDGRWHVPERALVSTATPVGTDIHRMVLTVG